jgi:hypothetical protein
MQVTDEDIAFSGMIRASAPVGILDAVRNALLDWSLKLEKSGIKGDGMSFSNEERTKAHESQPTYNIGTIGTFTGNMGSGSGTFAVEGNIVSSDSRTAILDLIERIRSNEVQLGLTSESVQNLQLALDSLQQETESDTPSSNLITTLLGSIKAMAEGAGGSLAASGILYELSKLVK